MERPEISVVVPLFNEERTVETLYERLNTVLIKLGKSFEIIFVDDSSTDGTRKALSKLSARNIFLRRNYGQFIAMVTGIRQAKGRVVITMDGDLENDPEDIPAFLVKLTEGFDVVSGWRRDRWKGQPFTRRIPSHTASAFISYVTGVKLHDYGCNMKAYRREILDRMHFAVYMQRMIAAYAAREGARVAEIPVRFEPRKFGKSNYGLLRTFKVFLDALTFHFFYNYSRRPMHFFGGVGFWSFFLAGVAALWALCLKIFQNVSLIRTPLPLVFVFLTIVGLLFILMGLLAEFIGRHAPLDVEFYEEGKE
ncbi:MAG: glycosyltransferase family 2 protein [Patescibacteria group bacterium]